ncbi:hypothetical protein Tco_0335453 [Tanacetum coccineum]
MCKVFSSSLGGGNGQMREGRTSDVPIYREMGFKVMLAKISRNDICNAYEKLDDVVIDETDQSLMAEKA